MDLLLKFAAGARDESCGSHHLVPAESCGKEERKVGGSEEEVGCQRFEPRTHLEWFEDPAAGSFVGQGRFRVFEVNTHDT
jgi:hypothetical protein